MNNVQINETTLLNLFMNRLEYWTANGNVLELYESYLKELINCGCFEGAEIDVNLIVDNLYINDTAVTDKEGLAKEYDIDVNDCERILSSNEDNNLFLVSTY